MSMRGKRIKSAGRSDNDMRRKKEEKKRRKKDEERGTG